MRSNLYIPAHRQEFIDKVGKYNPDCITLDLEDSVPCSEKINARMNIVPNLQLLYSLPVNVRINSYQTGLAIDDLDEVVSSGVKGICIPKVESEEEIRYIDYRINALEYAKDLESGSIKIQLLIETPKAIMNINSLVTASNRIESLIFGVVDYCKIMNIDLIQPNGNAYLYARQVVVNSAIAINAIPIDSPYMDFSNIRDFVDDCSFSKSLGYKGRVIINPKQVESANKLYSLDKDKVEWAKMVVGIFERDALPYGLAAISSNKMMIATPVYEYAKNILKTLDKYNIV